jgi:hypothetical protein
VITPADEQKLAEHLHALRQLARRIADDRPNCAAADDAIDDCLAMLDEAESYLNAARVSVLERLGELDSIEAGDIIETPSGTIAARYP